MSIKRENIEINKIISKKSIFFLSFFSEKERGKQVSVTSRRSFLMIVIAIKKISIGKF